MRVEDVDGPEGALRAVAEAHVRADARLLHAADGVRRRCVMSCGVSALWWSTAKSRVREDGEPRRVHLASAPRGGRRARGSSRPRRRRSCPPPSSDADEHLHEALELRLFAPVGGRRWTAASGSPLPAGTRWRAADRAPRWPRRCAPWPCCVLARPRVRVPEVANVVAEDADAAAFPHARRVPARARSRTPSEAARPRPGCYMSIQASNFPLCVAPRERKLVPARYQVGMNMSPLLFHLFPSLLELGRCGVCAASAACASQPAPRSRRRAAPPSQAFQQASTGARSRRRRAGGSDGVVFVDQGRKAAPTTHDDVPATSLNADTQTARPQR